MQVILIQDVNNLGGKNEIVNVKNGYARNYLIPSKYAVEASHSNLQQLQEKLKQQLKKEAAMMAEINKVIEKLKEGPIKVGAKSWYFWKNLRFSYFSSSFSCNSRSKRIRN